MLPTLILGRWDVPRFQLEVDLTITRLDGVGDLPVVLGVPDFLPERC